MNPTATFIAATQNPDGSIPWEPGRHTDPWNHTEAAMGLAVAGFHDQARAAYDWLATTQNKDGSWATSYLNGRVVEAAQDTNYSAYIAVGVRHQWLLTHDHAFLTTMWPTVTKAIDFVLNLQRPDGTIPWRPADDITLLAGNSSIHHSLRCAIALADALGQPSHRWKHAAGRLRAAIRTPRGRFTLKTHSMDWYYPVLCGAHDLPQLTAAWNDFVIPGLGVRCVREQPWITGGETAELALTLATRGDTNRARKLLTDIEVLRHHDGSYWTGYQFENNVLWPNERTTWTAGAILLAHAAVAGEPATITAFSA